MLTKETKSKSILNFNFKKNNLDELFQNLSDNPQGMDNKDFKLQLSTIYQLIEDELSESFDTVNLPIRNTDFFIQKTQKTFEVLVTPTNNFSFYLKSKGSMYRLQSKFVDIDGVQKECYIVPIELIWDYFTGLDGVVDFDAGTKTFEQLNIFTQAILKAVKNLYFIPQIKFYESVFELHYELFIKNSYISRLYNELKNNLNKDFITEYNPKILDELIHSYLNYLVFKFLNIKSNRFKDSKSAIYFTKQMQHKRFQRGSDVGTKIADWIDEIYIGKYEIAPVINISKLKENEYELNILIKKIINGETVGLEELYSDNATVLEEDKDYVTNIIEKQLNYTLKFFPELELLFEDENKLKMELDLTGVYKIITQTSYYLQRAGIEVILPEGLDNIVIPRASINARIKENRESELSDILNSQNTSSISLDEIMDFSYEIAIGDEKISQEEFEKLSEKANGLIFYKNKYILIDKEESAKIISKLKKPQSRSLNKMEIIHAALSSNLNEMEFNYDEAFANIIKDMTKTNDVNPPEELGEILRPYQKNGFKWLYTNTDKGFGCCMADDMGLGKTIQVISLILQLKKEKKLKSPALVVCPTTLLGNWMKEIKTFAPALKSSIYHGLERTLDRSADVILTTYAILRIDIEKFTKEKWGMLIIDEAQNIKNPDTSQAQAIKQIDSKIKIAMTGTPVENRLTELWSIFDFINKGYLGSLRDFQKSYAIPIERFKEYSRAEKLKLSVSPFILRRLKTDKTVIADLPEKLVLDEYCYLSKPQAILYEKVLAELMGQISATSGINRRGMIFKLITALKQICNHPCHYLKHKDMSKESSGKTDKFISLVKNIIENDEKTLVFTQYKEMGTILKEILKTEIDTEALFFHGSLNRNQREEMLEKFEKDENSKVMILSLKAGGTGLNLTSATNVIHYDLWWNPAVEDQATDRTYRIGQDKNVMVHRLITLGTFEEKIDEMIKQKKELANLAVFEGEKNISELSDTEIYEIFSLSA